MVCLLSPVMSKAVPFVVVCLGFAHQRRQLTLVVDRCRPVRAQQLVSPLPFVRSRTPVQLQPPRPAAKARPMSAQPPPRRCRLSSLAFHLFTRLFTSLLLASH